MRQRPFLFKLTSIALTLVLIESLAHYLKPDTSGFLYSFLVVYWVGLVAGIVSSWKPRPFGHFAIIFAVSAVVFVEVLTLKLVGFDVSVVLGTIAVLSGALLLGEEKLQNLFYNSKQRWWETSQRYFLKANAEILVKDQKEQLEIKNISFTGCLGYSKAKLPLESPVKVKLSESLTLDGTVVRIQNNDLGIQFNFKTRKEQKSLREYIRQAVAQQAT